jgi:hypothetical protein
VRPERIGCGAASAIAANDIGEPSVLCRPLGY